MLHLLLLSRLAQRSSFVECDLRRPRVNTALKITPTPGLTNYLNEECSLEDIVKDTKIENLKAITYGAIPPNPSELLSSESMFDLIKTLEKNYDYIIFDTPPIGVVIDALPIMKRLTVLLLLQEITQQHIPSFQEQLKLSKEPMQKFSVLFLTV